MLRTYFRGLLPSLGAGGSLVAAALVVAGIVSGMLVFDGWPGKGGAAQARDGAVVLRAPRSGGDVRAISAVHRAPGAVVAGPSPRPARTRGATRRVTGAAPVARRRASRAVPQRVVAPARPVPPVAQPAEPAPSHAAAAGSPAPSPARTPAPPVSGPGPIPVPIPVPVPTPPSRPVGSLVDQVHQVEQAVPVPAPVQPVVETVNDVLDGTAGTVDGVLGGLLGGGGHR
jgi:hypothetical protein